jgi:rod shape-determining protein MreD
MKRFGIYFLTAIVLIGLSSALVQLGVAEINLVYILVALAAIRARESLYFIWLAFCSGLLLDTLSSGYFGLFTLNLLLVVLIIQYAVRFFITADKSIWSTAGIVALSYLLFVGLLYFSNSIALQAGLFGIPLAEIYLDGKIWIDVVISAVLAVPLYFWCDYIELLVEKSEQDKHMPHV